MTHQSRCPESLAFEDLPAPAWELAGAGNVVVAANRAARDLLDHPAPAGRDISDVAPGLDRSALALIASVRETGAAAHRAGWAVEVGGRRILLEVDLVPVRRPDGDGVLVHSRELPGATEAARDATVALQRTHLPAMLPVLPGVGSAARYAPGALHTATGGDWFDVLVTDDGRVAAHTGDVVGSGTVAVAAMAALLAVLRAALAEGLDPGSALARLDRFAARQPGTRAATAGAVLLDPATGEFEHARCGHPSPALRSAGGGLRVLDDPGAAPLGIRPAGVAGPAPEVHRGLLGRGETLLLHTDGLLARTGSVLDAGPALRARPENPDDLCASLLDTLAGGGPDGDVTVLALHRRVAPVPALVLDVPADLAELSGVRARVSAWLDELDPAAETRTAVPLVVTELTSNAIEHAYTGREQPGRVRVRLDLDGAGGVRCVVEDDGTWPQAVEPPAPPTAPEQAGPTGGFGLVVVHELCDTVEIDPGQGGTGQGGTRVAAVCPARHAAVVAADATPRLRSVPDAGLTLLDLPGSPPTIVV
ncbi:MAG: SpoIIE family protein phosphatase, partial [Pseudonocardia sp.]|nr:SpoIIE family protein phosphatase [Pseudonocardia sp.]